MYYFKHEKQYFLSIIAGIPKHQEESWKYETQGSI